MYDIYNAHIECIKWDGVREKMCSAFDGVKIWRRRRRSSNGFIATILKYIFYKICTKWCILCEAHQGSEYIYSMQLCIHLDYFREWEREAKKRVREEKKEDSICKCKQQSIRKRVSGDSSNGLQL